MSAIAGFVELQTAVNQATQFIQQMSQIVEQTKLQTVAASNLFDVAKVQISTMQAQSQLFAGTVGLARAAMDATDPSDQLHTSIQSMAQGVKNQEIAYALSQNRFDESAQQAAYSRTAQTAQIPSTLFQASQVTAARASIEARTNREAIEAQFGKRQEEWDTEEMGLRAREAGETHSKAYKAIFGDEKSSALRGVQGERLLHGQKQEQIDEEKKRALDNQEQLEAAQRAEAREQSRTEEMQIFNRDTAIEGATKMAGVEVRVARAKFRGAGGEEAEFQGRQEREKIALQTKQTIELKEQEELEHRSISPAGTTDAIKEKQKKETEQQEAEQNQQRAQRGITVNRRVADVEAEGQQAQLQTQGKFFEAQKALFEEAAKKRIEVARETGSTELGVIEETIKKERKLMEAQHAWEMHQAQDQSTEFVEASKHRGEQDRYRAKGQFYKADEVAYKAAWDEKVKKQEDVVKETKEKDPEKLQFEQDKLDQLNKERKWDEAAHEYTKPGGTRDLAIRQEHIEDTKLEARGQYQTEQLKQTTDKAYRAIADAHGNKDLQTSIANQAKADIEKQEFDIKRRSLGQLGRSFSHSFEMGADNMKPLENLNDVMTSADASLKSIDKYLREQVAKTTP